jgi:hypothetical protein
MASNKGEKMKYERTIVRGTWLRIPTLSFVLAMVAMVFTLVGGAHAANPKLCFTQVTGLPKSDGMGGFTFPNNPPNVLVLGSENTNPVDPDIDTGWFNAFRLPFENGTPHPDGAMQAIAQGSMLYFSFKVKNDTDFDISDAVVLGFSSLPPETQNVPQTYTWIVIQPFANGVPAATAQAVPGTDIKTWKGTNGGGGVVWGNTVTTGPAWIKAVVAGSGNQWYVVVRIDNSDVNGPSLPMAGKFGLILDAVGTSTDGTDRQFLYPSNLPALNDTLLADAAANPATTSWADATFDGNCTGIHFDAGDINNTVNGSVTSVISASAAQSNNFSVKVHNSGADAPSIRATFKLAGFGLPAPQDWALIGSQPNNDNVTPNPTLPVDVPAHGLPPGSCGDGSGDGCTTINAPPWTLGAGNAAFYLMAANQHQCVRVDLEALSGDPTFMNNSSWNNFDFQASASKFVSPPAQISGRYPAAKGAAPGAPQLFDLFVTLEKVSPVQNPGGGQSGATSTARPGGTAVGKGGGDRVVSAANLVVHACRRTGTFVTIDPPSGAPGNPKPQKFENCETVGAYGYGIKHVGLVAVTNWVYSLKGNGLTRLREGVYRLAVPQDGVATVITEVQPQEPGVTPPGNGKYAIFADLGVAIPHGNFSTAFDPGVSFNAGLEYIVNTHFSAEGIFGAHHFPGKFGIDVNAYQFTGGGKVFFNPGPNRVFARAGLGGYHFDLGTTNFGGYVGVGVLHEFNARLGLEGVYNFHTVNTPGSSSQFSTIQGGLRYVFH